MAAEDSRVSERVPAAMRIKLKYPDVETFIEKYSVNISRGGIFIGTRSPKPTGTLVRFEFQLSTQAPIIRGEGQVIWVKPFDPEQPKKVHGMGIRFTKLDAESRALVDRALQWKREHEGAQEGEPRDGLPSEASDATAEVAVPEAQAETMSSGPVPHPISDSPTPMPLLTPAEPPPMAQAKRGEGEADHEASDREIIAELWQASQSQVVRAARQIAEMTVAHNYFPEDEELSALLRPLRIPLPTSGREAARLLRGLLGSGAQ